LALAFGLAFGLGGQQVAQQITQGWYASGQAASQKLAQYADRKEADRSRIETAGQPATDATVRPAGDTSR
jgi:hypothetical protein